MSNSSLRSSRSSRSSRAASPGATSSTAAKSTPTKRSKSPQTTHHVTKDTDREAPGSPPKRALLARSTASDESSFEPRIVTPGTALALEKKRAEKAPSPRRNARRSLSMADHGDSPTSVVSKEAVATVPEEADEAASKKDGAAPAGKKKLPFGLRTRPIEIPPGVRRTYTIVRKHTGNIGGNGCGGAIYGELTTGSMQKMTNLMIEHTGLSKDSRFIDVGCGLGKPNLHVAQYPGVDFSYGIEMERVRWLLGMSNLREVLEAARRDAADGKEAEIGHRCFFAHGDITEANFFDPFTHVYMFDIGFPPRLFHQLADMFNRSQSEYLICYHAPKLMVERYEFDVELVVQTPTSMHGSAEGHTGYIYRRSGGDRRGRRACKTKTFGVPCDPLFAEAWKTCRAGLEAVHGRVAAEVEEHMGVRSKRVTRSASRARKE